MDRLQRPFLHSLALRGAFCNYCAFTPGVRFTVRVMKGAVLVLFSEIQNSLLRKKSYSAMPGLRNFNEEFAQEPLGYTSNHKRHRPSCSEFFILFFIFSKVRKHYYPGIWCKLRSGLYDLRTGPLQKTFSTLPLNI